MNDCVCFFSHRCKLPGIANDTYVPQSYEHEVLINATIPSHTKYGYDRCHLYYGHHLQYDNYSRPLNASLVTCTEWVYDDSVYKHTFTKQVKNMELNDLFLISRLRKSEVCVEQFQLQAIAIFAEHGIHCMPCSDIIDVMDILP